MNTEQGSLDWAHHREGRASELCRRITFLVLFTPQGRPQGWVIGLGVLLALVAVAGVTEWQM